MRWKQSIFPNGDPPTRCEQWWKLCLPGDGRWRIENASTGAQAELEVRPWIAPRTELPPFEDVRAGSCSGNPAQYGRDLMRLGAPYNPSWLAHSAEDKTRFALQGARLLRSAGLSAEASLGTEYATHYLSMASDWSAAETALAEDRYEGIWAEARTRKLNRRAFIWESMGFSARAAREARAALASARLVERSELQYFAAQTLTSAELAYDPYRNADQSTRDFLSLIESPELPRYLRPYGWTSAAFFEIVRRLAQSPLTSSEPCDDRGDIPDPVVLARRAIALETGFDDVWVNLGLAGVLCGDQRATRQALQGLPVREENRAWRRLFSAFGAKTREQRVSALARLHVGPRPLVSAFRHLLLARLTAASSPAKALGSARALLQEARSTRSKRERTPAWAVYSASTLATDLAVQAGQPEAAWSFALNRARTWFRSRFPSVSLENRNSSALTPIQAHRGTLLVDRFGDGALALFRSSEGVAIEKADASNASTLLASALRGHEGRLRDIDELRIVFTPALSQVSLTRAHYPGTQDLLLERLAVAWTTGEARETGPIPCAGRDRLLTLDDRALRPRLRDKLVERARQEGFVRTGGRSLEGPCEWLFVGHGDRSGQLLGPQRLWTTDTLAAAKGPPMVAVVLACHAADTDLSLNRVSAAEALLRAGSRVVVASRGRVSDLSGWRFADAWMSARAADSKTPADLFRRAWLGYRRSSEVDLNAFEIWVR